MPKTEQNGQPPAKTAYERWQHTIDRALDDPRWSEYDCDIRQVVGVFNRHLRGDGYRPLDWRLVKAIIWTESGGPDKPAWRSDPMQIGNPSDPGLRALLSGKEGGDLILPAGLRNRLTVATAMLTARANIEAGTGYLLMRHAIYDIRTVRDATDAKVYSAVVDRGDSLDKFARTHHTTVEVLKASNGLPGPLRPGQTLKYQKASLRKVIVGWKLITPVSIATRYNVGDVEYSRKLNYCLDVMRQSRTGDRECAS